MSLEAALPYRLLVGQEGTVLERWTATAVYEEQVEIGERIANEVSCGKR